MERMEEDAKDLEKMASKQNLLHQKIDECTKKIRDLGSLPSDAFDKYQVFLVVVVVVVVFIEYCYLIL